MSHSDRAAQSARYHNALQQLSETRDQLAETHGRLRDLQEQLDRLQGPLRQAEGLRDELGGIRSENDRLRSEAEELRSKLIDAVHLEGTLRSELRTTRAQIGRIDLRKAEANAQELEEVRAERDRLRAELADIQADRLQLAGLADELEAVRADWVRRDAALLASTAREEQLKARILEVERRAVEERDQADRDWQGRLDAARSQLERDLPPLREDAERLRIRVEALIRERDIGLRQLEALGSDRDRLAGLLEQAEAAGREAARHQAEAHRLARKVEQDRDQLTAMSRRNEELAERARALQAQLDRLRRDREEEGREHGRTLEGLRHDLEIGLAEAASARERAATAAAARAELEGRVAELEGRIRAADERIQGLEAEVHARADRIAELESRIEPGRSALEADREADRLRIRELAASLEEARASNGRLRSLLEVFGVPDHLGTGVGPPAGRATANAVPLGRPQPSTVADGPGLP
jgi:chromosome segregation ATPase